MVSLKQFWNVFWKDILNDASGRKCTFPSIANGKKIWQEGGVEEHALCKISTQVCRRPVKGLWCSLMSRTFSKPRISTTITCFGTSEGNRFWAILGVESLTASNTRDWITSPWWSKSSADLIVQGLFWRGFCSWRELLFLLWLLSQCSDGGSIPIDTGYDAPLIHYWQNDASTGLSPLCITSAQLTFCDIPKYSNNFTSCSSMDWMVRITQRHCKTCFAIDVSCH